MSDATGPALDMPVVGRTAAEPRLVGRDEPLQALLGLLLGFSADAGPGAVVLGESGSGKTRLLQAIGSSVPGVLICRARVGDKLLPYSTLARLLRSLVSQAPQVLQDPAGTGELSSLLPELVASKPTSADSAEEESGPPSASLLLGLLRSATPEVVAWGIDDLHLADDASLELILALLLQAPPTALPWVIATQPPDPGSTAEAVLEAAAGLQGVQSLMLGPLAQEQIVEWLMDEPTRSLSAAAAQKLAQRLLQVTGGSPLHLRWLLHESAPAGLPAEPWATLAELPQLPTLGPLIGDQLTRLGPAALAVARAAAVMGQGFSAESALDFTGITPAEWRDAEHELQSLGLWSEGDFSHPRIREAARQATPEAMARSLHAHCAAWLEKHGGAPARMAAHWQAAGQAVQALPHWRAAARHAQRLRCTTEQLACLMKASRLAESHGLSDLAFDCCCEAFEAHTESIRHTDGATLLAQMRRLAQTPQQQARCVTQHAWYTLVHGHLDEAISLGEQALALAQDQQAPDLIAPASQYLGTALGVAGKLERALPLMLAAEPWVQRAVPPDERASFQGNLAAVLDNLGRFDEARQHHQQALTLAARHSDAPHRATLLANYALGRLEAGDPLGARELAQKAQALVDSGDAEGSSAGFIAVLMAPAERSLGRYQTALDWCDRAEQLLAERNPARMPVALLQRAHVWLDLGMNEQALSLLNGPGLPLGQQLPARHSVRWLLLLARALTRLGEDPKTALAQAVDRLPAEGWPELALLLQAEEALVLPGTEAAQELGRLAQLATDCHLPSVALGAWLQCALLASAGAQQLDLARRAADTALALMNQGVESTHVDRVLRWLAPARALAACGESTRAQGLLLRGRQWLQNTAAEQVPAMARQNFLHMHPLHLALLESLAA